MSRLGLLGCGFMGKTILQGILKGTQKSSPSVPSFRVSVPRASSVQQLQHEFAEHEDRVQISSNANIQVAQDSDVVLLCFPPDRAKSVLEHPGVAGALKGKLIISLLAGVPRKEIEFHLNSPEPEAETDTPPKSPIHIIRVMPSIGGMANESATLILEEDPPLPPDVVASTKSLFNHIGKTYDVPEHLFDSVTALSAVSHALMTVAIDAMIDGSAAAGIPRNFVETVAAQCLRGHATLVEQGVDNAELKRSVLIPGGMTVEAILDLERRGVRSAISDTVVSMVKNRAK